MKSEYRIITVSDSVTKLRFLQFKSKEKIYYREFFRFWIQKSKTVDCWRFILKKDYCMLYGIDFPTHLGQFLGFFICNEYHYYNSWPGQEHYDLTPFTKNYPDVNVYIQEAKEARKLYLEKQRRIEEDTKPVVYL